MITIQIDGKTYTVAREKMWVYHKLQQFINVWYLEEVKENKNSISDKQDQSEVKIGSIDHKFTPWQVIEVSNDGERWERKYFQRITDSDLTDWCIYQVWDTTITYVPEFWKFARPIEDKIELLNSQLKAAWVSSEYFIVSDKIDELQTLLNKIKELWPL